MPKLVIGAPGDQDELETGLEAAERDKDRASQKGGRLAAETTHTQGETRYHHTGLPDNLKAGIESLSGMSMDHVKVHYNSAQPARLNALAYAQGSDIYVAPRQERHLPHEAWHVVQQAQGRVQPRMQLQDGVPINVDNGLEREADEMGTKAQELSAPLHGIQEGGTGGTLRIAPVQSHPMSHGGPAVIGLAAPASVAAAPIQPKLIQISMPNGGMLWLDDAVLPLKTFATREEAEDYARTKELRVANYLPLSPYSTVPIYDASEKTFRAVIDNIGGAGLPPSLEQALGATARGRSEKFQTLDPNELGARLYGTTDAEKRAFLLLACEGTDKEKRVREALTLADAELVLTEMLETDRRKAVEEALTMTALQQINTSVMNVRRPPEAIKGKYDYLIDLPEMSGVPVDAKTIAPYVEKHWGSSKLTKAQRRAWDADVERGVNPKLPFQVAQEIAARREVDKPDNYARWIMSQANAQLHELTAVNPSELFEFKGLVVTNVAYISELQQYDLWQYCHDPRIIEYYGLSIEDLHRVVFVSPDI